MTDYPGRASNSWFFFSKFSVIFCILTPVSEYNQIAMSSIWGVGLWYCGEELSYWPGEGEKGMMFQHLNLVTWPLECQSVPCTLPRKPACPTAWTQKGQVVASRWLVRAQEPGQDTFPVSLLPVLYRGVSGPSLGHSLPGRTPSPWCLLQPAGRCPQ